MSTSAYKTKSSHADRAVYAKAGSKRRSRHSKKRSTITAAFKWAALNPGKIIGILCACIIIYISVLFYKYYKEQGARSNNHSLQIETE